MGSIPPPASTTAGVSRALHQPSALSQQPSSSSSQHAGAHLLSLKVMRASAPSLAVSEKPYYDKHDGGANGLIDAIASGIGDGGAHDLLSSRWESSASLVGAEAVYGEAVESFPISNVLVLPNSFGTLYLGETFRTYLCVRNESGVAVREPSLRVEMQVGASDGQAQAGSNDGAHWHQLAHVILPKPSRFSPDPGATADENEADGMPVWELSPGQALETSLGYDIKDLGPHVLVCTVGYKAPLRTPGSDSEAHDKDMVEWVERSFRKFYKFSVDRSPISVRTKVHQPRHASSLYHPDPAIRRRVELEVQVQNVTGNGASLVFQGLTLKSAHGWRWESIDRPSLHSQHKDHGDALKDMWTSRGSNEVLADGDIRQYLFTLTPTTNGSIAEEVGGGGIDLGVSAQGHLIRGDALGHLDIRWRMSLGEPGRLQTSQLVRRRVVLPPVSPASGSKGRIPAPQLYTQVTLLPSAVAGLRDVKPGSTVQIGVSVGVSDVSALLLRTNKVQQQEGSTTTGAGVRASQDDDDDDDTPLSEIASSPGRPRKSTASTSTTNGQEETQPLTIRRTLRLALQHCPISPPAPVGSERSSAVPPLHEGETQSTVRKSVSSRTSTPTQMQTGGVMNKVRFQANLTNLVRNTSLSLRPARASEESSLPPALPPKSTNEEKADEHKVTNIYPLPPVLESSHLDDLYARYVEQHAQALSRPLGAIPSSFLPTLHAHFTGQSLILLPDITLQLDLPPHPHTAQDPPRHRDTESANVHTTLQYSVAQLAPHLHTDVVRFGPLRVLLLGYKDHESNDEHECFSILHEIPVIAETLLTSQ